MGAFEDIMKMREAGTKLAKGTHRLAVLFTGSSMTSAEEVDHMITEISEATSALCDFSPEEKQIMFPGW